MVNGVVPQTLSIMRELGAADIRAWVGPAVCARCYEVPEALRDDAAAVVAEAASRSWAGTPAIDVPAAVVSQLAREDVHVTWTAGCTRESPDLFSYRRDGVTGRFAGLIALES